MKSLMLIAFCISLAAVPGAHAQDLDCSSDSSPTPLAKMHGATETTLIAEQGPARDADIIRMAQTRIQKMQAPTQKVAPSSPSQKVEGVIVRGDKATAQEGYKLKKSDSGFTVYRMNNNSVSGTFKCLCSGNKANGNCSVQVLKGFAQCKKSSSNGCTGTCLMSATIDSGLKAIE